MFKSVLCQGPTLVCLMEYANSDIVPEGGEYRCTSCGAAQEFEASDDFTICDDCGDEAAGWERVAKEESAEELGEEERT